MSEVGWVVTAENGRERALPRGRLSLSGRTARILPFLKRSQKAEVACERP